MRIGLYFPTVPKEISNFRRRSDLSEQETNRKEKQNKKKIHPNRFDIIQFSGFPI